jgi:hypothetical protein
MSTGAHPVNPTLDLPITRDMPSGHPFPSFTLHPLRSPLPQRLDSDDPLSSSCAHHTIKSLWPCLPVIDHVQIGHQGQRPCRLLRRGGGTGRAVLLDAGW